MYRTIGQISLDHFVAEIYMTSILAEIAAVLFCDSLVTALADFNILTIAYY